MPTSHVSVAIMAHPGRTRAARRLAAELGAPIVWDRGHGVWDTGRRALLACDQDATHHLVVQDDATLCRDLLDGLEIALRYAGQRPVGLYVGQRADGRRQASVARGVYRAATDGTPWISARRWPLWGVASVHPTEMIDDLVRHGDIHGQAGRYDWNTRHYYRQVGVDAWYTWPSLVNHRPGPSLLGNANGQAAWRFLGTDVSALDLDWSLKPCVIP